MKCRGRIVPVTPVSLSPVPHLVRLMPDHDTRGGLLLFCRLVPTGNEPRIRYMKYHVFQALMMNLARYPLAVTAAEWNLIADIAAEDDDPGVAIVATMAMLWCESAPLIEVAISRSRTSFIEFRGSTARASDTPPSTLPLILPQLRKERALKCRAHYNSLKAVLSEGNAYCQRSLVCLLGGFTQGLDLIEQLELILKSVEIGMRGDGLSSSDEWARMGVYGYSRCGELLEAVTAGTGNEGTEPAHNVACLLKREDSQKLIFDATMRYASDACLLPLVHRLGNQWTRFESATGIALAFPR